MGAESCDREGSWPYYKGVEAVVSDMTDAEGSRVRVRLPLVAAAAAAGGESWAMLYKQGLRFSSRSK